MVRSGIGFVLQELCTLAAAQATQGCTDRQLLERYVSGGDEEAFTALVRRHGPMVIGVCRRFLREIHDAEDAFQATFLVLARKAASIRKRESVGSWLHGVALRVARKARGENACRSKREQGHPLPPAVDPADDVSWGEVRTVLDEELGRLPAAYRAPLILCYLEGQTQDEAARRLGVSKSTFRRRLERGRRLLQGRLTRRGVTLSAGLCASLVSGTTGSAAVPKGLTAATVKTALLFGAGRAVEAGSLARPILLAQAVLKGMILAKGKVAAGLLLAFVLLAGAGWCVSQVGEKKSAGAEGPGPSSSAPARGEAKVPAALPAGVDPFGDRLPAGAVARLGTIRFRHGAHACAIAFAPDGRSLASAGFHAVVHIWDRATGKELLRFGSDSAPGFEAVTGLAYAPDGKTLAAARCNQPVCLWDVATGKEIRRFGGYGSWVVFSPDGRTLAYGAGAVGGGQDTVRLVDVNTGNDLHAFGGHKGPVARAAFSPDGKTLASADDEGIHLFGVGTGRRRDLGQAGGQRVRFSSVGFSPDGKTVAAASHADKLIRLVDVTTGKTLWTTALAGEDPHAHSLLFTPDGKTVITGHGDGFVRLWEAASGAKARQFRAHDETVLALALSPDGRTLATSSESHDGGEHTVRLWETATGKPLARYAAPQTDITDLVFSPDSRRVATSEEGAVHVWEAATGRLLRHWPGAGGPVGFTPDGRTLIRGRGGRIHFLDLRTGKEYRQFQVHPGTVRSLALSRDGKVLATAGSNAGSDNFLRLWDPATGRALQDFGGKQKGFFFGLALSPDAKILASIHQDPNAVRLWDTATGKLVREDRESNYIGSIAFSGDGKLLASTFSTVVRGEHVGLIRLREVATGREVRQLRGEGDALDSVAFSPDGRTLIWGGWRSNDLVLWEVATGQVRQRLSGHQAHLRCVAFSPDGRLMASGSADATALLWDATGQRRQQPPAPLSAARLDQLWTDLSAQDVARAYQAICTLRASPRPALALLGGRLKPVPRADPRRLTEALRNLDSDRFAVREQATKELESLGQAAEAALRQTLAATPSAEVRRRVAVLLDRVEGVNRLRQSRALEVLESIGDAESRRVLATLAQGTPQAALTQEARVALDRLGR